MMCRYYVQGRFGGVIKFTNDYNEALKIANDNFGIVFDTHTVPADTVYDPVWFLEPYELEAILNSYFPQFYITVDR